MGAIMAHTETKSRFMRSHELSVAIPYSPNHIRRLELAGLFPKRVQIGANRVGWVRAEVEQWLNDRMGAR
jgi:prophage regulatory protein